MDTERPAGTAVEVTLRDGTEAWIWPLAPTDRRALRAEFGKLSDTSRRHRFLSAVTHLSDNLLDHLVDDVDGVEHIALVLFAEDEQGDFAPAAVGRVVRYPDKPDAADIAVTVVDEWHGRGAASALLTELVAARPQGVTHLLTEVAQDNPASLRMLQRIGPTHLHDTGLGVYDVEVSLVGRDEPHVVAEEGAERLHPVLTQSHELLQRTSRLLGSLWSESRMSRYFPEEWEWPLLRWVDAGGLTRRRESGSRKNAPSEADETSDDADDAAGAGVGAEEADQAVPRHHLPKDDRPPTLS